MSSPADTTTTTSPRWQWSLPHITTRLEARHPRRLLLLCGAGGALELPPLPDCRVTLVDAAAPAVQCRLDELPFQSRVFDCIIAAGVLADGREPSFSELLRVLEPGGELLVLGDGHWSPLRRRQPQPGPGLRSSRLAEALRRNSFVLEDCHGHGLLGLDIATGSGWCKPLAALSDTLLVSARHRGNGAQRASLRLVSANALKPHPAVMEGLSREAS
jgi:SAM-dependent methyltransferase